MQVRVKGFIKIAAGFRRMLQPQGHRQVFMYWSVFVQLESVPFGYTDTCALHSTYF